MLHCIQHHIEPLRDALKWGFDYPYMLTGVLNQHPRAGMAFNESPDRGDIIKFYDSLEDPGVNRARGRRRRVAASGGKPMHRRRGGRAARGSFAAAAALALAPSAAPAQLASAVYTAAEAEAGRAVYEQACASCHMPDLRGQFEAPELAGAGFRGTWGGRPAAELLDIVRTTMPPAAPGSLAPAAYTGVVAYLLQANGVAPAASGGGAPPAGRPAPRRRTPARRTARAQSVPLPRAPRSPTRCCATPTRTTG